jgi:hypothetical protein
MEYFFFGTYLTIKSSVLCSGKYDSHKNEKILKLRYLIFMNAIGPI